MNLEETGAALKAEREKRGLTLDDVVNQLKINPRLLRSLEEGDTSSLPPPAYIKGFIRSYARFLGLSESELQELPKKEAPLSEPVEHDAERIELAAPARRSSGGKSLALLLIMCLLGGAIWWAYDAGMLDFLKKDVIAPPTLDERLPTADKYLAARDADKNVSAAEEKIVSTPEVTAPVVRETQQNPEPIQLEKPVEKETAPAVSSETPEKISPSQHKLIITAIEECWVHSSADKTDTRQFSLRKGDTFALTFAKSLELKLGNAGGVKLRYDGEDLPPPGTSGQVKTLTFPLENR